MSTRRIERTVVEGGRARAQEETNHGYTRAERHRVRQVLGQVREAADWDEAPRPIRPRQVGPREFADRLNVVERLLEKRAGRPWNSVYSELCRRVDRRTMKGWHLLEGHLVRPGGGGLIWFTTRIRTWFDPKYVSGPWVDDCGILRYAQRKRWWRKL